MRGRPPAERKGPGAIVWLLALPVLCCAGPAILAVVAAAGAATLGLAGGVLGALLAVVALGWWLRRRRRCHVPAGEAWHR